MHINKINNDRTQGVGHIYFLHSSPFFIGKQLILVLRLNFIYLQIKLLKFTKDKMHSFYKIVAMYPEVSCELIAAKHCLLFVLLFSSGLFLVRRHRFLWVRDSLESITRHLSNSSITKQLPFQKIYFLWQEQKIDGTATSRISNLSTIINLVSNLRVSSQQPSIESLSK